MLRLFFIILISALFRFNGINWDQGFHLHPDERFLTMVGNAMKIPTSIFEYFNPQVSTLSPYNVGFKFYVYGALPVVLNKIIAVILENDDYGRFTLQGRVLSGLFDIGVVFLVYKTVKLLEKKYEFNPSIKFYAAFFYTIAVLPIQLSHFFTVDTFLNFFAFASFYFVLRFVLENKIFPLFLSAVFLAAGIASKISAVFILPLIFLLVLIFKEKKGIKNLLFYFLVYVFILFISLRIFNPYYFNSSNFFDLAPNQYFWESLKSLKALNNPEVWFPPAVQWMNKSAFFPLVNLVVFGVGVIYFSLVILGFWTVFKRKIWIIGLVFVWGVLFFTFQALQFAKTMRYFIFLYPFMAIFAAFGHSFLLRIINRSKNIYFSFLARSLIMFFVILWPLMFSAIYFSKHTRVSASEWMYKNLPSGALILGEHWDDPLPLSVRETYGKSFQIELLSVFDPDTEEKWKRLRELLQKGDYYVLSSNRAWGSIPTVKKKYPKMSKYYKALLSEDCKAQKQMAGVCYKKIKEFVSYPRICLSLLLFKNKEFGCLVFPDDWAEEAFTVYDHPKVIILKKVDQK